LVSQRSKKYGLTNARLLHNRIQGVEGWGAGVVTLANGKVFGGDSGYLYSGTYTQSANTMNARVHVKQYVAGIQNVMGRSEFDLQLDGITNAGRMAVTGTIPGTPLRLHGILTKQGDL
jgi:T3SS negative regulator,GrlR